MLYQDKNISYEIMQLVANTDMQWLHSFKHSIFSVSSLINQQMEYVYLTIYHSWVVI